MIQKLLFLILLLSNLSSRGQQVTTIFNSNNMQIDDAIIQDKFGNIYGSHYMGSRVYKITPSGVVSIFKSGLNTPNGLALDSKNNLYIVDNIGNKIYKLDSTGNQLFSASVSSPSGIIKSIDSDTMIITQYTGHAVRKLAPDGVVLSQPMHYGFPLNGPVGLCYSSDSTLYVGSYGDRKIYKFFNDTIEYVAQIPGNSSVNLGFITYAKGLIYGTSFFGNRIYEINPNYIDSVNLFSGSNQGNIDGQINSAKFNGPNGIFASKGGDSLLISDFNTGNIRMISGLVTKIESFNQYEIQNSIYPNPNKNIFEIYSEEIIESIYILDMTGAIVFNSESINKNKVNVSHNLKSGNYILKLQSRDKISFKKLIIIK
jgi:sugar lactone lactonase YvrE